MLCEFIILAIVRFVVVAGQNRWQNHTGIYSGQMSDYELVIPVKTTPGGDFLSHELAHHHEESHRHKRDIGPLSPVVHYAIKDMLLELWPSSGFIGPNLVVEKWSSNKRVRRLADNATTCHYQGSIQGRSGSRVAVSACHGLVGLLRTGNGDFWLEPAENVENSSERPHLLFKRSATLNHHKRKKRKKRRKHEKNCGTREPRRLTETRLEWRAAAGKVQVKVQGRGKSHTRRWRRSSSVERHVEALLVADPAMMAFHRDLEVDKYLLTIMNMVSLLYLDPSIGNPINVVVVRIVLLMEDDPDPQRRLNITVNADETLKNFCSWQSEINPEKETDPLHHDLAILVTREDICARQNEPCSTLGVSHVAGMCQSSKSCNVNEDNGITLAHTIAHEMGHNFGMYHDTEKIGCSKRDGTTLHVMTPSFEADTVEVAWSPCSRRDITNFLDQGFGDCLKDKPTPSQNYTYPDLPPGAMYDADRQCRLQFGNQNATVCSPFNEICSRLWCLLDGVCSTMLRPAAPGTNCGKHMWCLNQQCVDIKEKPEPINGGWGNWGPPSECSRTCGAGVSISERHCDNPTPAFQGKFCVGERRRYVICNTQPCPEDSPSFREIQCSKYDSQIFHGYKYSWVPHFDKDDPCELYCSDINETMIVPFGESVADGTPCNVGTRDMCIQGICKKVGCDWVVDSTAEEDKCGVCHGDGSQCETVSKVYTNKEGKGYKKVVMIPSGSRNIRVEELERSQNFISIQSAATKKYYLNGKRKITLADEYQIAGSSALYEREKDLEKIRIPGPIKEDIYVYLIYNGNNSNSGLRYEYTIPKENSARPREYQWTFGDWSPCSATCGGGTQTSHPICREKNSGEKVRAEKCAVNKRPDRLMRACNDHPCPTRWWTGPWQLCPVTCGFGMRNRSVLCAVQRREGKMGGELALPDTECQEYEKPAESEPCPDLPPCFTTTTMSPPPELVTPSPTHAQSDETRTLGYTVLTHNSIGKSRDVLHFVDSTDEWVAGMWSPCSVTCGKGKKTRKVKCVSHSGYCSEAEKPRDSEVCDTRSKCNSPYWLTGPWSSCSVTCGASLGFQERVVWCINVDGKDCKIEDKPQNTRTCHPQQLCYTIGSKAGAARQCEDQLIASLCAEFSHLCNNSLYIRTKCCRTCSANY